MVRLVEPGQERRRRRALDVGGSDEDRRRLTCGGRRARERRKVKRERDSAHLRTGVEESLEAEMIDPMDGMHNRRYMESHLSTLVEDAVRTSGQLSILLADIDHFKQVNDTYGHDAGDMVLKEFSNRFRRNTRGIDLACRYGGEEFLVIMPDTSMTLAYQVGERLRVAMAADAFPIRTGVGIPLTASVGIATLECPEDTPETVFRRADDALFSAKRHGRNRVAANAA